MVHVHFAVIRQNDADLNLASALVFGAFAIVIASSAAWLKALPDVRSMHGLIDSAAVLLKPRRM